MIVEVELEAALGERAAGGALDLHLELVVDAVDRQSRRDANVGEDVLVERVPGRFGDPHAPERIVEAEIVETTPGRIRLDHVRGVGFGVRAHVRAHVRDVRRRGVRRVDIFATGVRNAGVPERGSPGVVVARVRKRRVSVDAVVAEIVAAGGRDERQRERRPEERYPQRSMSWVTSCQGCRGDRGPQIPAAARASARMASRSVGSAQRARPASGRVSMGSK